MLVMAGLTMASQPEAAEPEAWAVGRIVISARGRPVSQSETPGGVGVATEEDIALTAKASIADALALNPGVTISGDSTWGRDISIRGLGGTSVVVLIDGKRLNTATDINARLGFINPLDVERVEVLKGPVSSLYGSGSTGGVINIITRKGRFTQQEGLHGRASLSGVSNPAGVDAYGNLRYEAQDLWLLAAVGARSHDDTRAGNDERIPNSQYRDEQGRVAGAFKLGRKLTTEFQVMQTEAHEVGIPGGPGTLLPKAGPWMESVKRFFGVLMLALAIWIVAPVLPVAAQMLAWAALLSGSGVYLRAVDPPAATAGGGSWASWPPRMGSMTTTGMPRLAAYSKPSRPAW
jgi:hemoglobin/transferrin/lactoferrin receptor protein